MEPSPSDEAYASRAVGLFFGEYRPPVERPAGRVLRRTLGPLKQRAFGLPQVTGFQVWFELLVLALGADGIQVHENDDRYALTNPDRPVGLVGYESVLDRAPLPNPVVLGPGLYDHPGQAPDLMDQAGFRTYVVTCDWMLREFSAVYGAERCSLWRAGIDTVRWPDLAAEEKTTDVLIYDKIRFDREAVAPEILDGLVEVLEARGLSYEVLRYGRYNYDAYAKALQRSRSMAFLCEHETQGMAYQEAMASNLPIFAWDPGEWRDPLAARLHLPPVQTTSVPYFSPACGRTFRSGADLAEGFDEFWSDLGAYQPRSYVEAHLSLRGSARAYMEILDAAA